MNTSFLRSYGKLWYILTHILGIVVTLESHAATDIALCIFLCYKNRSKPNLYIYCLAINIYINRIIIVTKNETKCISITTSRRKVGCNSNQNPNEWPTFQFIFVTEDFILVWRRQLQRTWNINFMYRFGFCRYF